MERTQLHQKCALYSYPLKQTSQQTNQPTDELPNQK